MEPAAANFAIRHGDIWPFVHQVQYMPTFCSRSIYQRAWNDPEQGSLRPSTPRVSSLVGRALALLLDEYIYIYISTCYLVQFTARNISVLRRAFNDLTTSSPSCLVTLRPTSSLTNFFIMLATTALVIMSNALYARSFDCCRALYIYWWLWSFAGVHQLIWSMFGLAVHVRLGVGQPANPLRIYASLASILCKHWDKNSVTHVHRDGHHRGPNLTETRTHQASSTSQEL
jgi:hypothetical protein